MESFLNASEEFERFLLDSKPTFKTFHPHYEKAFWEMLSSGGKRFRPKLLFAVVCAYDELMLPSSLHVALAIEVLHTYSLIHDDLPCMDDADTRRGVPTLHKTYDEVSAVLVGDALNTHAFYLLSNAALSDSVKIELIRELSLSGGGAGMVLGQALDCHFEESVLSIEQLEILHINKTAKLIAASLKMGGIIVGLEKPTLQKLEKLGLRAGLMFQINDDIIDATLSSKEAGKDTRNDGAKNSYVNLLGLEEAKKYRDMVKDEIEEMLEGFDCGFRENMLILLKRYFK